MAREKKTGRSSSNAGTGDDAQSDLMGEMKDWVRSQGAEYLEKPNITSVGIGYKIVDGAPTDKVAIQFTVGQKVIPESLEAIGAEEIPESIEIGGVAVPTDVIQRDFVAEYVIVPQIVANDRKLRLDPISPGASVAHEEGTAGTIGCVVFDTADGTPYILSNWHVLHGPGAAIGDDIVQPGPFDDNRTHRNRLGRLVRSHLGPAGDCAIATIEDRAHQPGIIDLGVAVEQLGEPELGDAVVKSGRTTGVTYGRVTRIDTVSMIDYGDGTGEQVGGDSRSVSTPRTNRPTGK